MIYLNIIEIEKKLYNDRLNKKNFNHLWKYVVDDNNIVCAIKKIRDNGDKSVGPDGLTIKEIINMDFKVIKKEILKRLYGKISCKCREIEIPKATGGKRTLGIGNYYDRIAQQCVANIISPILEVDFHPHSFGFRRNMNSKHCIANIFASMPSSGFIYDCDLKSYFDKVNLNLILNKLRTNHGIKDSMLLKCIKHLMWQNTYKPKYKKYNGIGLKQGSVLGPILANVMLNELDWIISESAEEPYVNGRIGLKETNIFRKAHAKALRSSGNGTDLNRFKKFLRNRLNIKMIRYADDFILISKTEYELKEGIKIIEKWIAENELEINNDKTKTIEIATNVKLDFLGYRLRFTSITSNGRRSIIISPKDIKKLWIETKNCIDRSIYSGIDKLGLYLRGKLEYYSICTNLGVYLNKIYGLSYKYGTRTSIKNKFKVIKRESGNIVSIVGKKYDIWDMRRNSKDSIKDYIMTMKTFWDPNKENGEEWLKCYYDVKNYESINSGNVIYVRSLIKQYKKEPILGINYHNINPRNLEIHHIKPRSKGGVDVYSNLVLVHKESHKLIHNENYIIKGFDKNKINYKKLNKFRKVL